MYHIEQHFRFTFFKYYYFIFFLNVYSLTTFRVLCRRAVLVYLRGPGKCEEAVLWWLLLWHLLRSLLLYHHFVSSPPNTIYLPVSLHSKYILEKKYLHNKQIQYHLRQQKTRSRYPGTSPGCPNDLTVNKSVRVTETPLYVHAPISSQRCVIYGSMI